jgi:hypothetical protein
MSDQAKTILPFQDWYKYFNYLPWTNWSNFIHPQIINMFGGNVQDVDVEKDVLQEAGSYGKQLGTVLRVLNLLVARLNKDDLLPGDRAVIEEFDVLFRTVEQAVAEHKGRKPDRFDSRALENLEQILKVLARKHPEARRRLMEWLQEKPPVN